MITIKPIIIWWYYNIFFKNIISIYSFSGLGHTFVNKKIFSKLRLLFIKQIYKFILSKKKKHLIFQNQSDKNQIKNIKNIKDSDLSIIKGSGVNLKEFKKKMPSLPIIFLMASRLIIEKGVWEYINASKIVKKI